MNQSNIAQNISLAELTTFKVGGPAKYFCVAKNAEDVIAAINWAKENNQPIFVLADGSNVIASENGFAGLVIRVGVDFLNTNMQVLEAGAATSMKRLVDVSVANGLAGLEWAGGLPGSFGGAIRGNAGAFGGEIKDTITSIKSISTVSGEIVERDNEQCQFSYRDSIFKRLNNEIIISAKLQLTPGDARELREIADSRIAYRQQKHPMEYPNSGSIFKNTPIENIPPDQLEQWQENIKNDPFPVVPTAKIIADSGLAGLKVGGAQLSTKHTNYIVNIGSATGEDIFELI
ncbi:MAG: UDP-N-acetylmuramate dehydrogenase, partial [Patescibacteria group bacterium]